MSIAEFSAVMQDQAYKKWFKASSTNVLNKSVTELREYEEISAKTDFIISEKTVAEVVQKLTDKEATEEQVTSILQKLRNARPKKVIQIREKQGENKDLVVLKFTRVNLKQIGDILNQGFSSEIDSSGNKISDFFQRGHVIGVATNLVKQTQYGIKQSRLTDAQKNILLGLLDEYIKVLSADDIATSNINSPTHELYAKYTKNYRRYLVELQPKTLNQESGRSVAPISNSLRKYFKPENYVLLSANKLAKDPNTFFSNLIGTKGSPSMLDLIGENLKSVIETGSTKETTYTIPNTKVYSKQVVIDSKKANTDIKKAIVEAKKLRNQIVNSSIRTQQGQFYSLASLQVLLNANLQHVISANMGDGVEKRILNYRTGRFAGSVSVNNLTQSRQGMITAFYTYMKNPYQTFEPGFKQGSPRTRDPKLLIAKSITEIAATKVANRMRAVLV